MVEKRLLPTAIIMVRCGTSHLPSMTPTLNRFTLTGYVFRAGKAPGTGTTGRNPQASLNRTGTGKNKKNRKSVKD